VLAGPVIPTGHERALVELAQWLGRTLQYSATHPACQQLAAKTHATMTAALAEASPLVVGALKDDVLVDGVSCRHPAVRTRIGPCLHERGAMVLRLLRGVTLEELSALVEILTLPPQTIFDRGGVLRLAMDAGLARVQIEELAHDVTNEERAAQRRRARLRSFFRELLLSLLGRRGFDADATQLLELLEHPEIAVTILEENPAGIAEAVAGLALLVRQEEQRSASPLSDKLRVVLLGLSPRSRDRVLLGFPTLVDEFREAMVWAFDGFDEPAIARMAGPSVRANAGALDTVLYALSAAVPHDGTRLSALRWLGESMFDWPVDDAPSTEAVGTLAAAVPEHVSFRAEREILSATAGRVLAARGLLVRVAPPRTPGSSAPPAPDPSAPAVPAFDGRRPVAEVIGIATRTRSFDRFCERLPEAAQAMLAESSSSGVIGILRGLSEVTAPAWRQPAGGALHRVAGIAAERVLRDVDEETHTLEGPALEHELPLLRLMVGLAPAAALDRLDASENRKMRRLLLDALSQGGPALLPLVRARLRSDRWFVVRNAVLLLARVGGTARDLEAVCRHPEDRVRLEVVRSLRAMPAEESTIAVVLRCLDDHTAEVRQNAALLLRGELLSDQTVGELARVAATDARPEDVRIAAIDALGRCPRDAAAHALFELLQPQGLLESGATSNVRDRAAMGLRASPAGVAAELFARGMASSVRRVRRACERASGGRE
jgi:hypothetical protein